MKRISQLSAAFFMSVAVNAQVGLHVPEQPLKPLWHGMPIGIYTQHENVMNLRPTASEQKCIAYSAYSNNVLSDSSKYLYDNNKPTIPYKDGGYSISCDTSKVLNISNNQWYVASISKYDNQDRLLHQTYYSEAGDTIGFADATYNSSGIMIHWLYKITYPNNIQVYNEQTYNDGGKILLDTMYQYIEAASINNFYSKHTYEYNASGQLINSNLSRRTGIGSSSEQYFLNSTWSFYSSNTDASPYKDSVVTGQDTSATTYLYYYTYNSDGKILIDSVVYLPDMTPLELHKYSYPDDNTTVHIYQAVEEGKWINYSIDTSITNADGNRISYVQYSSSSSGWTPWYKDIYQYNDNGFIINNKNYNNYNDDGSFHLNSETIYDRNDYNNSVKVTSNYYDISADTLYSNYITNYYYEEYDENVGIKELMNKMNVSVYPIPAKDYLNIQINQPISSNLNLVLYDANGRIVQYRSANQQNIQLNIQALPTGQYVLEIYNSEHNAYYNRKFIKQ